MAHSRDSTGTRRQNSRAEILSVGEPRKWLFQCGGLQLASLSADELFAGRKDGGFLQIVPVNAEVFVMAHQDPALGCLLRRTVNTVDGRVLQWLCSVLYRGHAIELLKGADFILDLAAHCQRGRQRLFLLGASEESNAGAVAVLRSRFPGLQVCGFGPPMSLSPFAAPGLDQIHERIRRFRPDHLGVCFGPAKQEFWIAQNAAALEEFGVRCAYGLGGTIDFLSGSRPRAPRWMQYAGMEWLFRFLSEPRARFRRTLIQFKMPFYVATTERAITALPPL